MSREVPVRFREGLGVKFPRATRLVILARHMSDRLVTWIERTLEARFRLIINRDKTKIVRVREPGNSLDFLGYTFRYDRDLQGRSHRYLNLFPSRKALAKARDAIRDLTSPRLCFQPIPTMIGHINQWLTGWTNYFRCGYPRKAFRQIHTLIVERLTTHLRRRSQRSYRPPADKSFYAHVHDLGLNYP